MSGVLPEHLKDRCIQLGDEFSRMQWSIGDIVLEAYAFNTVNKVTFSMMSLYEEVAKFAKKSKRTVREYSHVCLTFPVEARQKYDVLSFDHFRRAVRLADPEKALQWCIEQTDFLNRPASVDMMIAKFGAGVTMDELFTGTELEIGIKDIQYRLLKLMQNQRIDWGGGKRQTVSLVYDMLTDLLKVESTPPPQLELALAQSSSN